MSKFIQIAAAECPFGTRLYALDDAGVAWEMRWDDKGAWCWHEVDGKRVYIKKEVNK